MQTNIAFDISPPIPCLAKFCFLSNAWKCCQPIRLQDSLNCNISRKKWMMKCIFGMQINVKVFFKLILSFWVCATRHAQSTQNKKLPYLCNISRKAWGWSWFLPVDKKESFLQVNSITYGLCSQGCPFNQNNKFAISL